jgi:hypothetical protein
MLSIEKIPIIDYEVWIHNFCSLDSQKIATSQFLSEADCLYSKLCLILHDTPDLYITIMKKERDDMFSLIPLKSYEIQTFKTNTTKG